MISFDSYENKLLLYKNILFFFFFTYWAKVYDLHQDIFQIKIQMYAGFIFINSGLGF